MNIIVLKDEKIVEISDFNS